LFTAVKNDTIDAEAFSKILCRFSFSRSCWTLRRSSKFDV